MATDEEDERLGRLAYAIDACDLEPITEPDMAKQAIQGILERRGVKTALNSLLHSRHFPKLIGYLDALTRGTEHRERFVKYLVISFSCLDEEDHSLAWLCERDPEDLVKEIGGMIREPEDVAFIVEDKEVRQTFGLCSAEFAPDIDATAYWDRRIRDLITRRQYRLAWAKLYRAMIGWPLMYQARGTFAADRKTTDALAMELYSTLRHAGRIQALVAGNEHVRLRHLCPQDRRLAYWHLHPNAHCRGATLQDVTYEGRVLLHLSAHFRAQRNTRRAQKKAELAASA